MLSQQLPYSILAEWSLCFPPRMPVDGRFMMWHAAGYYDESDDNERAYSVAGFIGHQLDFVHLDWAWREKILDKYGLKYFKASELNAGTGEFAKFRDDPHDLEAKFSPREKALFDEIKIASIDVILEFDMIMGLGAVVLLPDYHRICEEYQRAGKVINLPYFFASQIIMVESGFVMHHINSNMEPARGGVLRPVFDSHEQYAGRAKQMFDDFANKNPLSSACLLPPYYENDQQYVVLQAADNLAYECRRLLITQEYDTHIPERMAMKRLKECVYKVYKINYEALKAILEAQAPDSVPFEADIHNRHQLVDTLNAMEEQAAMNRQSEAEQFDATVRKVLSVSHKELQQRERKWKKNRAAKKRAKTSPASRASSDKD